jgi:hypothetical protein
MSYDEDRTYEDVEEVFKSNKLEKVYSDESFIHHSLPFWRSGMKQRPLYTDLTWLGSSINKFSGPQVLSGLKNYIINSDSYQSVNIKVDEYKSLLPLPFPRFFSGVYNTQGV